MTSRGLRALRSIVVPVDPAAAGTETAFAHALALSVVLKAELTTIHIGNAGDAGAAWHHYAPVRETLARWGLLESGAAPGAVREALGVRIRKVEAHGPDPAATVAAFIAAHPAHLLVLASAARRGLARLLHPSIAAGISRRTRLLTLYLPERARGFVRARDGAIELARVLVPVDREPDPRPAMTLARDLAHVFGDVQVPIDLLHVGAVVPDGLEAPADDAARCWRLVRRDGNPPAVIAAAAADADLIVMATAGRRGGLETVLGSTAEQVLARAPCALLTVPATAPDDPCPG